LETYALAHRWEPERQFMILTSYLDESGTHGGVLTVMAGFLADARQWRKFEKRTTKLFVRFRVDIFHTIDVKRSDKDFEGWSVDRKIQFLDEFHHIINETTELGYVAILRRKITSITSHYRGRRRLERMPDTRFFSGRVWPTQSMACCLSDV
jgi:hypothetical protein